jgi:hypothetical protein
MKRMVLLGVTLALLAACGSPMEYHLAKTANQDCDWLRWFKVTRIVQLPLLLT